MRLVESKTEHECQICKSIIGKGEECFLLYVSKSKKVNFRHATCQFNKKKGRKFNMETYLLKWRIKTASGKLKKYLKKKKRDCNPDIILKYIKLISQLKKQLKAT